MNGLALGRLEPAIPALHCCSVGSEGVGRAGRSPESWQVTLFDGASLGRQAEKVLHATPPLPRRENVTLKMGERKEGKRMFSFDVKIS